MALNLYVATPPDERQQATISDAVNAWYAEGGEGALPSGVVKGVVHDLTGPTIDGAVMRWQADLGSVDGEQALRVLSQRLAALPDVPILQLVLGTETVG